ncbi:MAG: hypothetical protein ACXV2C_00050 [Candidatus Bathyarchaeia archaeon]
MADALSRHPDYAPSKEEIEEGLTHALLPPERFGSLMAISSAKPTPISDPAIQLRIVQSRHDSPFGGHFGTRRTLDLVKRDFIWPNLKSYVKDFVKTCSTCQRNKVARHRPYSLLSPLPIAKVPWTHISMDFVVKLPPSDGFDSVLVVVDRFSKMSHFIACNESIDTPKVVTLLIRHVFKLHGLPSTILKPCVVVAFKSAELLA